MDSEDSDSEEEVKRPKKKSKAEEKAIKNKQVQ